MLYELVGITRRTAGEFKTKEAAEIAKLIGKMVINNRGVVRKIENMGVQPLPKIWNKSRQSHIEAVRFHMLFDSSPSVQRMVQHYLQQDARMLRCTIVKQGGNTVKSLNEPEIKRLL